MSNVLFVLYIIIHAFFGLPYDNDPSDDIIRVTPYYIYSYNCETKLSNWVAYKISNEYYGDVPRRSGRFLKDKTLPCDSPTHDSYTNTGFDRGHIVRSEERTNTREANDATFVLSNVFPQVPELNRKVWLRFEEYCEDVVKMHGFNMYVVAGPIYGANSMKVNGMLTPIATFKAVIICKGTQPIDTTCVMMPNDKNVGNDWTDYIVPLDEIEMRSGYLLFKGEK